MSPTPRPLLALLMVASLRLFAACAQQEPLPRGELVLQVDTDLLVPELASRMRVDTYSLDGAWFDSRDVFLGNPDEWPASFSLVHPTDKGGPSEALVRIRVFPDGATRSYRGEKNAPPTTFEPIVPATSLGELCASAPELALGGVVTLRRGRDSVVPAFGSFNGSAECKKYGNAVGSVAAHVVVTQPGLYHFAVIAVSPALPENSSSLLPQVTLELRKNCTDNSSGLACTYGMYILPGGYGQPFYSSVDAELQPGTYHLVTGGILEGNGVTDVTLAAWSDAIPLLSGATSTSPPVDETDLGPWTADDPASTPREEPEPARTIDRLIRVSVNPHERAFASVLLHGDCVGRAALLAASPGAVVADEARTCVSDPEVSEVAPPPEPSSPAVMRDALPHSARSRQGTFAVSEPCGPDDSDDRVVCVPSGAFLLGGTDRFDEAGLDGPPRTAAIHRFFVDRYELTVADYRNDVSAGLALRVDDTPFNNPSAPTSPSQFKSTEQLCTFSKKSLGRESLPLTCIPWYGARAWCQFRQGDLPSSAQWEYAALRAGRDRKTPYPWGETPPDCACDGSDSSCHAEVFGRDPFKNQVCIASGFGPAPSADLGGDNGDTSPLGIVGLGGNVREWTLDSAHRLDHPCWSSVWDPVCSEPFATARMQRGSSFVQSAYAGTSTFFWQPAQSPYDVGVRCVYAEKP